LNEANDSGLAVLKGDEKSLGLSRFRSSFGFSLLLLSQFSGQKIDLIADRCIPVDQDQLLTIDAAAPAPGPIANLPQQFFRAHLDVHLSSGANQFAHTALMFLCHGLASKGGLSISHQSAFVNLPGAFGLQNHRMLLS